MITNTVEVQNIKTLLGEANSYTDAQIDLCVSMVKEEIEAYCNRSIEDLGIDCCVIKMAIIKLERIGSDAVNSESYSGISQSFIDGYPADIIAILNRKRKIKTL